MENASTGSNSTRQVQSKVRLEQSTVQKYPRPIYIGTMTRTPADADDGLRKESMTYPDGRVIFYGYDNATQGTVPDRLGRVAEIRQTHGTGQQLASYDYF